MTDAAFELLVPVLNNAEGSLLWLVDENISAADIKRIRPRADLLVISNRFDLVQQLMAGGFNASLSDFELPLAGERFDQLVFRISKEKALVHHIINRSAQWLHEGGSLTISGFKNEGIKTYLNKAAGFLGELAHKARGDKASQLATIKFCGAMGQPLEDKNYSSMRLSSINELSFYSKPGVFGWQKIDKGSAFLIEQLPQILAGFGKPVGSILDLGCGYGYLSLMANGLVDARIDAVDNNIAAVAACRENFRHFGINGQVVCDDCGNSLQPGFELVICNPPFHQGFDIDSDLTAKFLSSSRRLLQAGGSSLFVVNAFIPLERKAADFYDKVVTVANNKSFKVLLLSD